MNQPKSQTNNSEKLNIDLVLFKKLANEIREMTRKEQENRHKQDSRDDDENR